MALSDKQMQTILSSGEITEIKLGGTATTDVVQTKAEMTATNISQDNSGNELSSTDVAGTLGELANVGLGHMMTSIQKAGQAITTTPTKIDIFDMIHHDINGAVTPSPALDRFTIDKSGLFRVYGTVTAEFSSSNVATMQMYKNGVAEGFAINLQGRGAGKPVIFSYTDLGDFIANDYLEIYVSVDGTDSIVIDTASMIVERTIF